MEIKGSVFECFRAPSTKKSKELEIQKIHKFENQMFFGLPKFLNFGNFKIQHTLNNSKIEKILNFKILKLRAFDCPRFWESMYVGEWTRIQNFIFS